MLNIQEPRNIILIVLLIGALVYLNNYQRIHIKKRIRSLSNSAKVLTPKEFLAIRAKALKNKHLKQKLSFAGVYILFNETKKIYYVGQGKDVVQRVNNHFTGKGNGDVYADYKYGDTFTIRMIRLQGSGFRTLNELERYAIDTYHAYNKGYNKTRGNK